MRKLFMSLAVLACAAFTVGCSGNKKITEGNKSQMDTLSYCIGADLGRNTKQQFGEYDFNVEEFKSGIKGGLLEKSDVTADEAMDKLDEFFSKTIAERQAEFQKLQEQDTTAIFKMFVSEDESKDIAYSIGVAMGSNVREADFNIQYYWLLKAIDDTFGETLELTEEQMRGFMMHFYTVTLPAEAQKRSEEWLAKKEKESGVKKTESGLLYKVVEAGDMEKAAKSDNDTVKVHFVGKLNTGKVFNASRFEDRPADQQKMMRKYYPSMFDENGNLVKEDEPVEFPLNAVPKGWTEGLKLVGQGGKIILYVPSELAYGQQGAPRGGIGPNEALEFVFEVIEVIPNTAAEEAKARSEQWLAEKEKESGVKKTESGLLYKVIKAGNMKKAATKDSDVVKVHYVGKLQNGEVFDSSRERKQTIEFPLNGVIKGWTEGMKLIGPGGKILLYIPAELAYGARGAGANIGPNEALEFEVELFEVNPEKK